MGIVFKQSFKNTLFIYLGFLIGGINTLVFYPRFLKEEYYGLVTYLLSSSNLIMPLTAVGVHFTIVKFFSAYKTKIEQDKFLNVMLVLPLFIALPIGFLWDYVHNWIMRVVVAENAIVESYTAYIYIIAVSCAYFEVFYSWAKVQMQTVFGNVLKELYNRLAVMLLLVLVSFQVITKQEFVVFLSYAYILRVFIMMFYAFKLRPPRIIASLPSNINEVLKYTFYILLAGSASAVILDIDKVMIPGKEGFKAAAYYGVAVYIGSFIEAPSRAMTQILQPLTSKSINENNKLEVASLYKKSSINLLVIGGLFFLLVNCNVSELFKVIPDKGYAGGELVVLLISLAKMYLMFLGNNNAIIGNSKHYRITLPIGVGMALCVYFLNKWLITVMGTDGLALATLITVFIFSTFKLWFVKSKFNISPVTKKTWLHILLLAVLYLIFNFWNFNVSTIYVKEFPIHPLINIALKSILIVVVYIPTIYFLNISPQIRSLVDKLIAK